MHRTTIICVATSVLLTGCNTLRVYEDTPVGGKHTPEVSKEATRIPGLPFYAKRLALVHETVWQQTSYEIDVSYTLIFGAGEKSPTVTVPVRAITVPGPLYPTVIAAIRKTVNGLQVNNSEDVRSAIAQMTSAVENAEKDVQAKAAQYWTSTPGYGPLPTDENRTLRANHIVSEMVIDTEARYYVNGVMPLLGSSSVDFSLSADQTLTNAKASAESKTFEQVLGVLPAKDYFSKALGLTKPAATATPSSVGVDALAFEHGLGPELRGFRGAIQKAPKGTPILSMSIAVSSAPKAQLYTVRTTVRDADDFGPPMSLQALPSSASLVIADVESAAPKKEDKSQFQFSGVVTPPKS